MLMESLFSCFGSPMAYFLSIGVGHILIFIMVLVKKSTVVSPLLTQRTDYLK